MQDAIGESTARSITARKCNPILAQTSPDASQIAARAPLGVGFERRASASPDFTPRAHLPPDQLDPGRSNQTCTWPVPVAFS
jgi:hypothetical protein